MIEIGGGETPLLKEHNFLNVDIRNIPEVDVVASVANLSCVSLPKPVSHIFSRHMLEHLATYEIDMALKNIASISSEGTVIEIIVPNIRFHTLQYLSSQFNSKNQRHALAGFNGWQRCSGENYWDVHKSSFDRTILANALSTYFKFEKHAFITKDSKHLHFIGIVESVGQHVCV